MEYGVRNTEYGVRSTEHGARTHSPNRHFDRSVSACSVVQRGDTKWRNDALARPTQETPEGVELEDCLGSNKWDVFDAMAFSSH